MNAWFQEEFSTFSDILSELDSKKFPEVIRKCICCGKGYKSESVDYNVFSPYNHLNGDENTCTVCLLTLCDYSGYEVEKSVQPEGMFWCYGYLAKD